MVYLIVTNSHDNFDHTFDGARAQSGVSLDWPPVHADGYIPGGHDIMPYSELPVPKFWTGPIDAIEFEKDHGRAGSIFLMIASYRDFQCRETVISALTNAANPEVLYIGIVDQISAGDTPCDRPNISCAVDQSQMLCVHADRISVFTMDAELATGPTTARHIGNRLYRGQAFSLQIDAHCVFTRHWDVSLRSQWSSLGNDMAVLTHYLSDSEGAINPEDGSPVYNTRSIMCNSEFDAANRQAGLLHMVHGVQPEEPPAITSTPQLQPFWAAGFSFSRGHFMTRVPYDNRLPMMFQVYIVLCVLLLFSVSHSVNGELSVCITAVVG